MSGHWVLCDSLPPLLVVVCGNTRVLGTGGSCRPSLRGPAVLYTWKEDCKWTLCVCDVVGPLGGTSGG